MNKLTMGMVLSCALLLFSGITVQASGDNAGQIVNQVVDPAGEVKTEIVPEVTATQPSAAPEAAAGKTIIALGADLTEAQKAEVLGIMGVSADSLADYTVVSVTNDMEHQYLDAYLGADVIGSKSLSSVMLTPAEKGHGVVVTTQNINYCTTGMYRNALLTAGVEDADIMVVGPTEISGTAALIGAIKAYEESTGVAVSDQTLDIALNELVTTGAIATKSASSEEVEALVAYIKGKIAAGELENEDDIRAAIAEGEQKFGVTLEDAEVEQIVSVMLKIKELGLDPNMLVDQAADLYEKWGDDFVNHLDEGGFFDSVGEFFSNIGKSIGEFFTGLFS